MQIDLKKLNIKQLNPQNQFEEKVVEFINDWFLNYSNVSVQTSGSTGIPKIFEVEKKKMLHSAKLTCDFLGLSESNSALLCLPIEYISGKMMVVRSIERNLKLFVAEPSTTPLKNLETEIDFCAMTPLQVENSLGKIHLIKKLIIGGAAVSDSLKRKILKLQSGSEVRIIYETYGMSETLSHIALKEIYPNPEDFFTILDGVEISLDDRDCLKISAPKLHSEILTTNDLVELKNSYSTQFEHNQFRFLGRIDNVINSGGAKIFPEELESLVKKEIENEVVFVGVPDETLGQKLILIIEGKENETLKFKIQNLKFQKSLHKPKETVFLEKLPRTPNGKIDRLKLASIIQHPPSNKK